MHVVYCNREVVAKETMRGEDLKKALTKFSNKYDSPIKFYRLVVEGWLRAVAAGRPDSGVP